MKAICNNIFQLTRRTAEVIAPEKNTCLNLLFRENNVTGRKAKIEKGHPTITPAAATATAIAGFSRRKKADDRDMAYIENELGKKPEIQTHTL